MSLSASTAVYTPGNQDGEFKSDLECTQNHDHRSLSYGILRSKTKLVIIAVTTFFLLFLLSFILLLSVVLASSKLLPLLHLSPSDSSCPNTVISTAQQQTTPLLKPGATFRCGNSSAEAKAAGCVFDLMSAAWLPRDCYDSELNAEFMELGPWPFYTSNWTQWDLRDAPESQRVLLPSVEAIGDETERMWTDRRFHVMHCIFAWKLMHRSVERGWKLEETTGKYHHTEHCSRTLANTSVPLDAIVTRVEMSFPAC